MYRARYIIAGSLVALFAAALAALALLPSYLALHAAEVADSAATSAKAASDADRTALASLRTMISALSPLAIATSTPTQAINHALSMRPAAISIDRITYTAGDPSSIALSGASATREAINGYRQALSADAQFKSVSIPVADLTAAPGARFSLTLMGTF